MDLRAAIYRFCNYQERCHQEVRDKLYELGAYTNEVNQLIATLIEDGLLNEERFAVAYVRGKFRLKHWGRVKIIRELKQHRISEYLIRKSLKEIDPGEYFAMALKLGKRKYESLDGDSIYQRKGKTYRYLMQKGYESSLILEVLEAVVAGE